MSVPFEADLMQVNVVQTDSVLNNDGMEIDKYLTVYLKDTLFLKFISFRCHLRSSVTGCGPL